VDTESPEATTENKPAPIIATASNTVIIFLIGTPCTKRTTNLTGKARTTTQPVSLFIFLLQLLRPNLYGVLPIKKISDILRK